MTGIDRRKWLLAGAIGFLGLLVLDRLVLSPTLAGWRDRQDLIVQRRAQLADGNNLLDQETRWLRRRDEMQQRLLPPDKANAEKQLLGLVDDWARDSGFKLTALRPLWKQTEAREPLLELQVNGTGGMSAITRFLYAVETAPTAIAIEQLELSAQGQDGRELGLNMRWSGLCGGIAAKSRSSR